MTLLLYVCDEDWLFFLAPNEFSLFQEIHYTGLNFIARSNARAWS
jgi:hypothetical protein